jgi:hypothetical protein
MKVVEKSSVVKDPTDSIRNKDGITEPVNEDSKAIIHHHKPECLLE